METITYTAVRKSLARMMARVCGSHEPLIITRQCADPVVMISLEDYRSLEETAYLLGNPRNAARLASAQAEIKAGLARERELAE